MGFAEDDTYISSAYNIGIINSDGIAGAILCADNFIWGKTVVHDSFYEKEKNPALFGCGYNGVNGDFGGIQAKSGDELKQAETYPGKYNEDGYYYGWDFQANSNQSWAIDSDLNNGYPYLKWEPAEKVASTTNPGIDVPADATSSDSISVTVNNKAVTWTDAEPFIDANNRTMVPLRAVADAMGLTVSWDAAVREASFTDGSKTIIFPIGSTTARTGDGKIVAMDTAAVIVNDRTYAPIRYLAE